MEPIPIVERMDLRKVCGKVEAGEPSGVVVTLLKPVPRETIFSVFGNVMFDAIDYQTIEGKNERDKRCLYRKIRILAWSLT